MAIRITYNASVSWEFDQQPCQTWKGEIVAPSAIRAASRAVQAARKAFPGSRPRSIVVVLEVGERVEAPGPLRRRSPDVLNPVNRAILGEDPSL